MVKLRGVGVVLDIGIGDVGSAEHRMVCVTGKLEGILKWRVLLSGG